MISSKRHCASWLVPCLIVLCLSQCARDKPLNVLLITLDTTRADYLGCYGNAEIETPTIDGLAARGIRYDQAFTPVPITLPSHLSILSGTYPAFHGVRENAGYYVPEALETLPEILAKRGYDTAAVVGAFPLDSQTGIDSGFDLYDDDYPSRSDPGSHPRFSAFYDERPASEVARSAMAWLDDRDSDPFFLWTHFFDAHQPWTPPSPFRERYAHAPYMAEIAAIDHALERILAKLSEKGLADNTLIIVTADHGEGLGEHGEQTHALLLYSSTLRVPLIVADPREQKTTDGSAPSSAGNVVTTPVGTIDIFSTVLTKLGLPVPDQNQGLVLPKTDSEGDPNREILAETLFGRLFYGWSPLKRLTSGDDVLISGPSQRLFDRAVDPKELNDRTETEPDKARTLSQRHREVESQAKVGAFARHGVAITSEDMERLAALGYVGANMAGMQEVSDAIDPDRMDPLISMHIFDLINDARVETEGGRPDIGIALLEKAIADDPKNPSAIQGLANAHMMAGNLETGLTYAEELLKVAPEQVMTYVMLANFHTKRQQYSEAVTLLRKAVDLEPADMATRVILAFTLEDAGKPDESIEAYREILALDARHIPAANGLATLLYRAGDADEAAELFENVLKRQPYFAPAYLNLAIVESGRGNTARAIQLGERALRLRPEYTQARTLLNRLQPGTSNGD